MVLEKRNGISMRVENKTDINEREVKKNWLACIEELNYGSHGGRGVKWHHACIHP